MFIGLITVVTAVYSIIAPGYGIEQPPWNSSDGSITPTFTSSKSTSISSTQSNLINDIEGLLEPFPQPAPAPQGPNLPAWAYYTFEEL